MAASSSQSSFTSFEKPAAPPAAGFFVSGLVLDIKNCGIVLNIAQTFVRGMAKVAVIGPVAKLDLGNQGRLREHEVLSRHRHDRLFRLQLVERRFEIDRIAFLEPGPDRSDRDPG